MKRVVLIVLALLGGVLLIGSITLRLWFRTYRIPTGAMSPTIPIGSHVIVRQGNDAARGTIIAFTYPERPQVTFLSRVVAVGGDVVQIRAKQLFVNGAEAREPYVVHDDPQVYPDSTTLPEPYRSRDHFGPYRVQDGHVFVLGDNRDRSADSRYFGSAPRANVSGRVIAAYTSSRVWRP